MIMWCMKVMDWAFTGASRRSRQDKVVKDYIKIEYRDGGNLYLPATRLEGIQKYADADARTPKLNKLGGHRNGTKRRAKVRGKRSGDVAKDLVELYAARQRNEGYPLWTGYGLAEGV